jgi:cell wall-associated NlpC family hydrolase
VPSARPRLIDRGRALGRGRAWLAVVAVGLVCSIAGAPVAGADSATTTSPPVSAGPLLADPAPPAATVPLPPTTTTTTVASPPAATEPPATTSGSTSLLTSGSTSLPTSGSTSLPTSGPGTMTTPAAPPASTTSATVIPDPGAPPGGALPAMPSSAAPSTATTVPGAPSWQAQVSPPQAAPTVPAPPAELALAARLEQQIEAQSEVLDVLADRYNLARQRAAAADAAVAQVHSQLARARADEMLAGSDQEVAVARLRAVALDAYLGVAPSAVPSLTSGGDRFLESGVAELYSRSAFASVSDRLTELRAAKRNRHQIELTVEAEQRQALAQQAAATAAQAAVGAAAAAATALQQQQTATLAKVQGDLVSLVAADHARTAVQAYTSLAAADLLDFRVRGGLPPPRPQTTAAIDTALSQLGKPYQWGGTGPTSFDCSGLVQWSWAHAGVHLPRVAADQQAWAIPVPISQLEPGDLVFFGNPAHHVGMYVGHGLMVDAPHTGADVEIAPIWWTDLAGFGRVR